MRSHFTLLRSIRRGAIRRLFANESPNAWRILPPSPESLTASGPDAVNPAREFLAPVGPMRNRSGFAWGRRTLRLSLRSAVVATRGMMASQFERCVHGNEDA
jgi:hypothetical protein